jgi:hypothetical protein
MGLSHRSSMLRSAKIYARAPRLETAASFFGPSLAIGTGRPGRGSASVEERMAIGAVLKTRDHGSRAGLDARRIHAARGNGLTAISRNSLSA